jgi:hydroxymethylbilane synthase
VAESDWNGAIFAAAGLERIGLRPENAIELDWMLPAPAQGAILVVARDNNTYCLDACSHFHDAATALCTAIERDFLKALMGGCSTPISALARMEGDQVVFEGNILSKDGTQKQAIKKTIRATDASGLGWAAAQELLKNGGQEILNGIRDEN